MLNIGGRAVQRPNEALALAPISFSRVFVPQQITLEQRRQQMRECAYRAPRVDMCYVIEKVSVTQITTKGSASLDCVEVTGEVDVKNGLKVPRT